MAAPVANYEGMVPARTQSRCALVKMSQPYGMSKQTARKNAECRRQKAEGGRQKAVGERRHDGDNLCTGDQGTVPIPTREGEENAMLRGHKDLKVFQMAYELAMHIFHASK